MSEDRVVELRHPGSFSEDPLTSVLRSGARRLLAQAVEMEVTAFIAAHGDLEDDAGRRRVVRHGHHRERRVQTGIGPVAVRCPRVRDRGGAGEAGKIRFTSAILPPYLRRRQVDRGALALALPEGHLDGRLQRGPGRSSGAGRARALGLDDHALEGCLARRAGALGKARPLGPALSLFLGRRDLFPAPDGARQAMHPGHHRRRPVGPQGTTGNRRRLSRERPVVARAAARSQAARPRGGARAGRRRRGARLLEGLAREPRHDARTALLAAQDRQRSEQVPKSLQAKAKGHLQDIWLAETKDRAEKAFDFFLEAYGAKYDKATACLAKDRAVLLTFYDFPAEHWKHLRTTNPIESTFATVRLRTIKSKGVPQPDHGAHHGLQVVPVGSQEMATSRRISPPRRDRRGRQIQGRRKADRTRRLKTTVTNF